MFNTEQQEYVKYGIPWTEINFIDNSGKRASTRLSFFLSLLFFGKFSFHLRSFWLCFMAVPLIRSFLACISMIEGPGGILSQVTDVGKTPKGNDQQLLDCLMKQMANNPYFGKDNLVKNAFKVSIRRPFLIFPNSFIFTFSPFFSLG
jgi:hypothetical protein